MERTPRGQEDEERGKNKKRGFGKRVLEAILPGSERSDETRQMTGYYVRSPTWSPTPDHLRLTQKEMDEVLDLLADESDELPQSRQIDDRGYL